LIVDERDDRDRLRCMVTVAVSSNWGIEVAIWLARVWSEPSSHAGADRAGGRGSLRSYRASPISGSAVSVLWS